MRAPYSKPSARTLFPRSPADVRSRRVENFSMSPNMLMLVALLASACVTCFGTAYYLFVTRWDARVLHRRPVANQQSQVVTIDFHEQNNALIEDDPHEIFLAYLPHSGFHNQRIAFENALVLARLLNRTLLVPPIRLGIKPLRYLNYDALYHMLALSNKEGLYHCSQIPSNVQLPLECADYFDYTHISWDWLVNVAELKKHQALRFRWNMTEVWIDEQLKISQVDILTIKDSSAYQYRFLDTQLDTSPLSHKFLESVYLPELALSEKRLIHLGTLFGSSRLRLKDWTNVAIRSSIRQTMGYSNPLLVEAANSIAKSLGHRYLGVHLRLGDGQFRKKREDTARIAWWTLVQNGLGYSEKDVLSLERVLVGRSRSDMPHVPVEPDDDTLKFSMARTSNYSLNIACKYALHTNPHLFRLNAPLFISTDLKDPRNDPLFAGFHKSFPCAFYLSDFPDVLAPLAELQNANDGVMLKPFLLPFLDAMVVAHAWKVIGTEKSTFSMFVQDVLWRTNHGMAVVQRG